MGLLDSMDDPRTMGLLSLGMGLMNSRGNFGQALGQAGPQALEAVRQVQMDKQKKAQQEQLQKMQALQMQQAQMAIAEQQRAQAQMQARQTAFKGAFVPGTPGVGSVNGDYSGDFTAPGTAPSLNMNKYLQALVQGGDVEGAMPIYQSMQKDTKPIALSEGGELRLPDGTLVARNAKAPEAAKPTDLARLTAEMAALPPNSPLRAVYASAIKKASTHQPPTQVSVDLKQEGAYRAAQGKEFSDFMAGVNKAGFTAPAQIRKLERMQQLLDGVDGGKLAPMGLEIASAANSLGIKMDPRLGNKEAAQALSRDIAGGFRQPGTGPMTDKDFDNFLLQVPDLSKTAEGRKQITATMKAAAARDMALSKLARDYEKRNGQLDSGFMDEAAQFIAENPVVGLPAGWKVR